MPLTKSQRKAMFITEALTGDAAFLAGGLRTRRVKRGHLRPGDMVAVKRQTDSLAVTFTAG